MKSSDYKVANKKKFISPQEKNFKTLKDMVIGNVNT